MTGGLGRRQSPDDQHIRRYPLRLVAPETITTVERVLPLWPSGADAPLRQWYDQGQEGACTGYSASWMVTMLNKRRYAPHWLYEQAQAIDEWTDTPPEEGSSVRATFDVLRTIGHRRIWHGIPLPAMLNDGIAANRWATTVDELRTSIAMKAPGVLGINWYANFETPVKRGSDWWVGVNQTTGTPLTELGRIRGGHAIVFRGASDHRQAILLTNTWGASYPDVYVPYPVIQRLIDENGEAGIVSDR
jgi:hypothetical protein